MKKYQIYAFDYTTEPDKQKIHTISICDSEEEAERVYNDYMTKTSESPSTMVRIREFDDGKELQIGQKVYLFDADSYDKAKKKKKIVGNVLLTSAMMWGYFVGTCITKKHNS